MVKSKEEVIAQFKKEVNMSAEQLERWLEDPKSETAGTGVGTESGHKIVEILRKNPTMDPEQFDEDDINHMRKVVGYVNRHLAQEDHLKETKTKEELENAKSTISLKNWGHNPAKTTNKDADAEKKDATTPEDAIAEGEDQIQDIKQGSATETANSDTANRKVTKRRLDQDDEEQFKPDNAQDSTEDDARDGSEDEAVNDEEDRPRKKSKTVRVA